MQNRDFLVGMSFGAGLLALGLALMFWPQARAGVSCGPLTNIQNGQPANATVVMANYNILLNCFSNAAQAGVNSDITSLSGLTTPITPQQRGSTVFIGGTSTGTNTQTVSVAPSFSPQQGYVVEFTAGATNTGPLNLIVNSTPSGLVRRQTLFGLDTT